MKKFALLLLGAVLLSGCAQLGYVATTTVEPDQPLLAADIEPYFPKRAVVLAFREPTRERGLGFFFASRLLDELLAAGPFATVGNAIDTVWFDLDLRPREELSSAAAMGAELGFDVAIFGDVERFVYSRNAESHIVVTMSMVDTATGRMLHQQRIIVRGHVGYVPPFWDPSNYKAVDREDLFQAAVTVLVRRMHVRWWEGETEGDVLNPYEEDEADQEGTPLYDTDVGDGKPEEDEDDSGNGRF